ncbi:MAG: hypothetical protein ACP5E2_02065 [Terracidiphilus sp.]
MATQNLSLEDFLISDHRAVEIPGAWKYRLILPLLYAMIGVALGTLTGVTVAIINPAVGNSWFPIVSAAGNAGDSASQTFQGTAPAAAQQLVKPAAMVDTSSTGSPAAHTRQLAAPKPIAKASKANHLTIVKHAAALHSIQSKARMEARSRSVRAAFARIHRFRLAGSHRMEPAPAAMARTANAAPALMMAAVEQLGLRNQAMFSGNEAAPSAVFVEGDFTVASYDASHGTIETNDGRTFAVGMTVVAGSASTWDDSGSNVHYRCNPTGVCTLSGSGIFAPNARLI